MMRKCTAVGMIAALTLAAAFARPTVQPAAALTGIVVPAGATATFFPVLFSACNQITWGYQTQPGATVAEATFPGGCTTGTAPSVTIGPFATDVALRVFISDVASDPIIAGGGTYYSDSNHALVTPLNSHIYTVAITDSGFFGEYVGQPRIPTPGDPGNLILTLTINSLNPTLTAQPTSNITVGDPVAFQGMQWNPTGGPITVSYDDHLQLHTVATIAATSAFQGQIDHAEFAHSRALSKDLACTATLRAQQGSNSASVQLASQTEAFVYAAAATQLAQPTGSAGVTGPYPLCTGESANLSFTAFPVFMWAPQTPDAQRAVLTKLEGLNGLLGQFRGDVAYVEAGAGPSGQAQVNVVNGPEGLLLHNTFLLANGASFCMGSARGLASLTLPPAPNGSVGGGCLSSFPHGAGGDVAAQCAALGVPVTLGSLLPNNTTLTGVNASSGSVTVNGNLHLNNAVVCVKGDLKISGTVDGVGALFVNGGTTVLGKMSVTPAGNIVLSAGGDVQLHEGSRTPSPFH
ncbi:MAG: hypothetical protein ACYDCQ_07535 [Dehalococcoidia bacterium]